MNLEWFLKSVAFSYVVYDGIAVYDVFSSSEDQVISKYQKLIGCSRGVCMVK